VAASKGVYAEKRCGDHEKYEVGKITLDRLLIELSH